MSGRSSSPAAWWSALEPAPEELFRGRRDPEDPRIGDIVRRWNGGDEMASIQVALIGFCSDEGTRRNFGRPGAAQAPNSIRQFLFRLTTWDPPTNVDLSSLNIADVGNITVGTELESTQLQLGAITAELLKRNIIPVILGGGHETAFGHYLGYAAAGIETGLVNVDAHLDVRPYPQGAHSGSPFRQAIEHPTHPLHPGRYVVIGAQRQSCARVHVEYVQQNRGRIHWFGPESDRADLPNILDLELTRVGQDAGAIMLTVDVDAFRQADVPGCSAPSPLGMDGALWPEIAYRAGKNPLLRSLDIVEVNPSFDRDSQTSRWAALGLRQFLVGLARRLGK